RSFRPARSSQARQELLNPIFYFQGVKEIEQYRRYSKCVGKKPCYQLGESRSTQVKAAQQSIWPVSVFGLGFLLLIIGLSGVANIQETRRIHEQILSVEDNYRRIESLVESIRSNISRVAILRRDRLLESA